MKRRPYQGLERVDSWEKCEVAKLVMVIILIGLAGPVAQAKEARYRDYSFEVREGDRLSLAGLKAVVKINPSVDARRAVLRVRKTVGDKAGSAEIAKFDALNFQVRREGSVILVEVKGPESKASFQQWMKQGSPEIFFDMDLPPLPVEISLREGQVSATNWRQPLAVNLVTGSLKASGTEASLRLQIQKGHVAVQRHRGSLAIDSFAAKVAVQEVEGDVEVTNFSGETAITRTKGNLDLTVGQGATTIAQSSGSMEFSNGHGFLNASGFDGPVKGQTEQGAVSVSIEDGAEADVRIESNQGGVTVKLPANSGSMVRMQTEEGSLTPPSTLQSSSAHGQRVSGRLSGSGAKGAVSLKSKSGNLRVKI